VSVGEMVGVSVGEVVGSIGDFVGVSVCGIVGE